LPEKGHGVDLLGGVRPSGLLAMGNGGLGKILSKNGFPTRERKRYRKKNVLHPSKGIKTHKNCAKKRGGPCLMGRFGVFGKGDDLTKSA